MKKSLILSILSLIILFALPVHAVKKIEANPINIAVMLVQENDSAKMVSTCDYYGYVRQPSQEGYAVFTHKNGSIIRFKVDDQKHSIVEVSSKNSQKEKDQILKNLNFHKKSKGYELKTIGNTTRCVSGSHNYLILTQD